MITPVSNERLTRHEISWLLAQEARGAAKALREGVTRLTHPPPPGETPRQDTPNVETTLDALDGAIGMLSVLQSRASKQHTSRRGRIDLAALLYEIAPRARIKMAPGEGTEVFGDEAELRRILHMLVNQTHANPGEAESSASPEVDIRRDGDMVKISVDLGPDSSATAEIERRWLSRMAVQHGGRLEFKGGSQSVFLPADGASDQREVVELRKELEQAQQLGEAYARELAGVFASGLGAESVQPESASVPAPVANGERFETLISVASGLDSTVKDWLDSCRTDLSIAARELGDSAELTQRLSRRFNSLQQAQRELFALAKCPVHEPRQRVDAAMFASDAIESFATRTQRSEISVSLDAPPDCRIVTYPEAFKLMLRALIEHAIFATPKGKSVHVQLRQPAGTLEIKVADSGPNVPRGERDGVLLLTKDPTHLGRPGGISLLVAHIVVGRLGGTLALGEGDGSRTETRVRLTAD